MAKYAYHQIDGNQQAIIDVLEAGGCSVEKIGRPVDLLVGKAGRSYVIEVKQPKGKLRESQEKFFARWKGHAAILRSVDEAQQFLRTIADG